MPVESIMMDSSSSGPNLKANTKEEDKSLESEADRAFLSILYSRPSGENIVCGSEEYFSDSRLDLCT